MDTSTVAILESLAPLFKRADAEGLWFFCSYQGLWFSPDELRSKQADGKFLWGAVNWTLRDPKEGIQNLTVAVNNAQKELENFYRRVG